MKKVHISFANEKYYRSLDLLEKTSLEIGKSDQFIRYTQEWLRAEPFWNENLSILNRPRGAGYWIWKPYIILKTFETLSDGDVVLYSDAGLKVIDSLEPLFSIINPNINDGKMFFKIPWENAQHIIKMWTKRDAFILTNCDKEEYWNGHMVNGATSLWIKNEKSIEFLNEWQTYIKDPRIVTDDWNTCGNNFKGFKEHRHDQSVLSIMRIKYNYQAFRDPTQFGNAFKHEFTNSPYEQLFDHHRGVI